MTSRYDIPEVMCRDETRAECSDMTYLEHITTEQYIQTVQPSYEGKCQPRVLTLDQKVIKTKLFCYLIAISIVNSEMYHRKTKTIILKKVLVKN